jgi:hypothetical protein
MTVYKQQSVLFLSLRFILMGGGGGWKGGKNKKVNYNKQ